MGRLKTFRKYIIWIVAFYLFSMLITYVGLNSTYKDISTSNELSDQVKVDIAQATKVNGRIYGEVTNSEENNLNGKYLKVKIYDKKGELRGEKFLKIENTEINVPKKFMVYFTSENIESYSVVIVDDSEETQAEIKSVAELFKDVFTDKELGKSVIIAFVLWAIFY